MDEPIIHQPLVQGPHSGRYLAAFALPATDGRTVRLWDFRQRRNVVLFFHHGSGCQRCRAELTRFNRYQAAYRERNAEVVAIAPDDLADQAELATALGLSLTLLSDPTGQAAEAQGVDLPAVVVGDRFEQIWAAWSPSDELDLPTQEEVLGWLEFISIQCHNRAIPPEWGQRRS